MQGELDKLYIRWIRSGIIVAAHYTQPRLISGLRIRFARNQAEKVSGTKGRHKGCRRGPHDSDVKHLKPESVGEDGYGPKCSHEQTTD